MPNLDRMGRAVVSGLTAAREGRMIDSFVMDAARLFEQTGTPEGAQFAELMRRNPEMAMQTMGTYGGFQRVYENLQGLKQERDARAAQVAAIRGAAPPGLGPGGGAPPMAAPTGAPSAGPVPVSGLPAGDMREHLARVAATGGDVGATVRALKGMQDLAEPQPGPGRRFLDALNDVGEDPGDFTAESKQRAMRVYTQTGDFQRAYGQLVRDETSQLTLAQQTHNDETDEARRTLDDLGLDKENVMKAMHEFDFLGMPNPEFSPFIRDTVRKALKRKHGGDPEQARYMRRYIGEGAPAPGPAAPGVVAPGPTPQAPQEPNGYELPRQEEDLVTGRVYRIQVPDGRIINAVWNGKDFEELGR